MALCKYPVRIKNPNTVYDPSKEFAYINVPCGKCMICKQNHSRQWIFRLKQEVKTASCAFFVTLTYTDDNLILTESGIAVLSKTDLRDYFKRLRKRAPGLKYFACGEYGHRTKRPHYHAIIFNAMKQDIEAEWRVRRNEDLVEAGHVHIGDVTSDSIAYNTKYIMKQNEGWQQTLEWDRSFQKEFATMSKKLGAGYLDNKQIVNWHKSNLDKNFVVDEVGYKYPIPRYYKDKIFTDDERKILKRHSSDLAQERADLLDEQIVSGDITYEEIVARQEYQDFLFHKRQKQKHDKL